MFIRELNCLFFHIPKAAGTSVERWLLGGGLDPGVPDYERLFGWERSGDFAVVRNPYARAVSAYHYVFEQHQQRFGSFEGYVRALPALIAGANPRTRGHEHHLPQVGYTRLDGAACCHELARFERLPDSLRPVAERLGITRPLPFSNSYRHPSRGYRPVSSFYTPETARLLAEVYAEDFASFGYALEVDDANETGS